MKLKNKLSEQYAWDNENRVDCYQQCYKSYIAGFEKAREMAKADVKEWLEITGVIPKGTSYYSELVDGFDDLGEEEL